MSAPEPTASISTPLVKANIKEIEEYRRPRRHTITRPDSAMALLSDLEDLQDEDEEQQKTFDRISGILSNLIQEANEAVNGIEKERVQLLNRKTNEKLFTCSTIITNTSKIPRPRKSRHSITPIISHSRNTSTSSSSTLVTSPISRSPSPILLTFRNKRHRPVKSASVSTRRSITPSNKKQTDPIMESYKRLDSSMALVDSLSRDLATTPKDNANNILDKNGGRLTILLLIPLLHIPHSLITMIFDFFLNQNQVTSINKSSSPLFNFTTMVFWTCVFTLTNLMVDQTVIPNAIMQKVRRISLPGSFKPHKQLTVSTTPASVTVPPMPIPSVSTIVPAKRTWIPSTIQKQYQFRLGEDISPPQVRRNSI